MSDIAQKKFRIDVAMGFFFFLCFMSGLLRWPTRGAGEGLGFLTNIIHLFSAFILAMLVFFHLSMNWDWLVCMIKKHSSDDE